jgi:5-methylcytosine-specific restriction protein A
LEALHDDIAQDGAGPLSVALDPFLSHIVYLQSKAKRLEAALHQVHDEFVEFLKGMAVHETVAANLDVADQKVPKSLRMSGESVSPVRTGNPGKSSC